MNNQNNSSALSDWINDVIRDVAELQDRDSPADAPDMMLVTGDELRDIIAARAPKMTADRVQGGLTLEQKACIVWGAEDATDKECEAATTIPSNTDAAAIFFDHIARAILSRQSTISNEALAKHAHKALYSSPEYADELSRQSIMGGEVRGDCSYPNCSCIGGGVFKSCVSQHPC